MKVLLDACVWGGACTEIRAAGHDVVWAGVWEDNPSDVDVLARAQAEQRVLVTLDKDFGELVIVRGHLHCGIVRLVNFSATQQAPGCLSVLATHGTDLESGAIVTAEPGRLRVRPAPGDTTD